MEKSPGQLRLLTDRRMALYFALSLPAVALEGVFATALISSPNLPIASGAFGSTITTALGYIPLVLVLLSVYSVLRVNTTRVLQLLVFNYFLCAMVAGNAELGGRVFGLSGGEVAALVVAVAFLSLISFGYARAAKVLEGRKPIVKSGRALKVQAVAYTLDFIVPGAIAGALVFVTSRLVAEAESVLSQLPPPLSSAFSSEFVSPISAAFVTVMMTLITLWAMKELVEPWVMYYAMTREDAVSVLLKDLTYITKRDGSPKTVFSRKLLLAVLATVGALALVVSQEGVQVVYQNIPALLHSGTATSQHGAYAEAQSLYNTVQGDVLQAVRLLWG